MSVGSIYFVDPLLRLTTLNVKLMIISNIGCCLKLSPSFFRHFILTTCFFDLSFCPSRSGMRVILKTQPRKKVQLYRVESHSSEKNVRS